MKIFHMVVSRYGGYRKIVVISWFLILAAERSEIFLLQNKMLNL